MHYYVKKFRQNFGLETCKWRQIVTSQTANTKYKWPPYDPESTPPHENFLRTPLLTALHQFQSVHLFFRICEALAGLLV